MTQGTAQAASGSSPSAFRRAAPIVALVLAVPALVYFAYRGYTRGEKTTRTVVVKNDGALCVGAETGGDAGGGGDAGAASGVDLRAEQSLAIGVRSACLSTRCVTDRAAKCSVKREGSKLLVTSEMSWTSPTDLGERCPPECAPVEATCASDPLPPGNYTIVLGAQTHEVTLPSHRPSRCLDPASLEAARTAAARASAVATSAVAGAVADAGAGGAGVAARVIDPADVPAAPGTGVAPSPPPKDIVCIGPANTREKSRALRVGQPLAITVIKKNPCEGASCAAAPPKCVVKRKGKVIAVDAQFPGPTTKPRHPCTEDCGAMVATCRTDALPAGTYAVNVGSQHETVTIPSPASPPCDQ